MDAAELRSTTLFDGLPDDALERCAQRFQEAELLAGSGLTREGDFSYKFFVILEGEVEVLRDFSHVADLGPGEFFGEMGLVTGTRRNARVVAKTPCRLAWVMSWDFDDMLRDEPEVAKRIEQIVEERMGPLRRQP